MKMSLLDLVTRDPAPEPWSEGDNIPWDDPEFSERMLEEHLSQDHDLASRREGAIDVHVEWICDELLAGRPARILDLACGPGLYTSRLARRGSDCVGIDFSPASIRHARGLAEAEGLRCTYRHADVRDGGFGERFDLVMLIYGQLNVFPRHKGRQILERAHAALNPGGRLLLEVQSAEQIHKAGQNPPSWYSAPSGLFSAAPHIVLQENFWNDDARASTNRFSVIEAESGLVSSFSLSNEAYTERELVETLEAIGFSATRALPSLTGEVVSAEHDLPVFVAVK